MRDIDEPRQQVNGESKPLPRFAWGAGGIAAVIDSTARKTHHLLIKGEIKCARKKGGRWVAAVPDLLREFGLGS